MEPAPGWHLERSVASNSPNDSSSAPDRKLSTDWPASLVGGAQPWGTRCLSEAIRSLRCIPPNHLGLGALEGAIVLIRWAVDQDLQGDFLRRSEKAATVVLTVAVYHRCAILDGNAKFGEEVTNLLTASGMKPRRGVSGTLQHCNFPEICRFPHANPAALAFWRQTGESRQSRK